MFDSNFYFAFTSSFWIIPREGTEALLIVLALCSALKQTGRGEQIKSIFRACYLAILVGALIAIGCIELKHIFTGQGRELVEAFASLIAMSMILYVNFNVFQFTQNMNKMSIAALSFMAFISVLRELSEVILFYIALFDGGASQQLGTLMGIFAGIAILILLLITYRIATDRWKKINKIIFNVTPFLLFLLAIMCIGNAINSFQEARWLGFTPINWMPNSNLLHIQASSEYILSIGIFLASTGLLFLKQFSKCIKVLLNRN